MITQTDSGKAFEYQTARFLQSDKGKRTCCYSLVQHNRGIEMGA